MPFLFVQHFFPVEVASDIRRESTGTWYECHGMAGHVNYVVAGRNRGGGWGMGGRRAVIGSFRFDGSAISVKASDRGLSTNFVLFFRFSFFYESG